MAFRTEPGPVTPATRALWVVYRGVGTSCEGLPGTITLLVPLPLLTTVPGIAEPGIITDWAEPGEPVTIPGPRAVGMLDGMTIWGGGAI
jgi:hypothetical protein